jgi:hypothetical protein
MCVKRTYKDSVFTKLFDNPVHLLALYNAITGKSLPADTPVEIATLTDVLFTHLRNDIAFVIDGKLVVLIEHQSTINENMPLRLLIYIARIYEKLIDGKNIYHSKLVKLPKPDFIVLYNGKNPFPDEETLRLSDAYREAPQEAASTGLGGKLELEVRIININESRNEALLQRCAILNEYTKFIGKTRRYTNTGATLEEAVTQAVRECVDEGILAEFLKNHGAEVLSMISLEYNAELERTAIYEEGFDEGFDEGRSEGRDEGRDEGRSEGRSEGRDESVKIASALTRGEAPERIANTLKVPIEQIIIWKDLLYPN